jgi:ribosomal protein S27AE
MATYRDGNVHRATPNTVTAMKRSAERRQCPKCGRKSALVRFSDEWAFGSCCRWSDCNYENVTQREWGAGSPTKENNDE